MKKKKIKDPEKYIEKLRREIKRLNARLFEAKSKVWKLHGNVIVDWEVHEREQSLSDSYALGRFKPGEKVAIIGRVVKSFAEIDEDCENKLSGITYKVLQTRKIEE